MDEAADQETEVQEPTVRRKRAFAWTWFKRLILLLALLVGVAVLVLNSSIGKRFIADQIAEVAPASGLRFTVGRIEGDLFGAAILHDVTVADPKGVFLTIPMVEIDWQPLSWITSGLDVETLIARRGSLLRVPELLPGDPDAPVLPDFDIKIGRFEIDQLKIAKGIVGDSAPVVNLLAEADIRRGHVYFKAEGTLGAKDTLVALIDAEPDGDRFDLDLDYRAPAGGVLASLIGVDAGYTARIVGDGSWSKWDGAFLAKREQTRFAAFKLTNRDGQFGLQGQAYPDKILSGLAAKAAGRALSIGALGTLEDSVLEGAISVIGAGLRGKGNGRIDLADNRFDGFKVDARLTNRDMLGNNFKLENTRLVGTLDGAFRAFTVKHRLTADQLISGTVSVANISQEGTASYDGTRWMVPLKANVGSVKTGTDVLDPKLVNGDLAGTLIYSGSKLLSDDLRISFPDAKANLSLRGDIATGVYQLTGPVDMRTLALKNVGAVTGNAKIDLQILKSGAWALNSNFVARIPAVTNRTLANLAGSDIRTKGSISIGSAIPLDFRNVSVIAENVSLTMDGKVRQGATSLAGRGTHRQYGAFTVEASLDDSGPTANLVFARPLPSAGLQDVRVAIRPSATGFDIDTKGQSVLGEFAGNLSLTAPEGGPTRIDIRQLHVWKTSVSGQIVLAAGGADGALALNGGGLDGKIGLAARGGGQGFAFDIDANNARFGGGPPLSIANGKLEGRGYLKDGESTVDGNLAAEGLSYGTLFIGRMAAASELRNGSGTATASIAGRRGSRFNLQLNAEIAPERIAIASRGEYAGRRIVMPRRAVVTKQDDGGWQLARTLLAYGDGGAVISGEFGGGRTAVNLALDKMPLTLVDLVFSDIGLGGTISGRVDFVASSKSPPKGNARVRLDDLTRSGLVLTSQPIDLALVSNLTNDKLELRAVITEQGKQRGRLQARIIDLPRDGKLTNRFRQGDLAAQLRFNGPAAALWRLAGVEAFDLTGPVAVAANVTGTLDAPRVRGSIASDNLRVQSAISGTDIRSVSARGSFAGSRLRLTRFAGTTDNGGTVSGSGTIDLQGLGPKGPEIDLRVAAKNAHLLNAAGLDATITGPLRILSDGNGGTIAGRVAIDRASWRLGNADEVATLPRITTTEINLPADLLPPRQRFKPWRYLIDAKAQNQVFVEGLGLESEWEADLNIRGTTSDPRIGGGANVVRGYYRFAGTRFELERGKIAFDASVPIDPRLDIVAQTSRDGFDVSVTVKGNALQPEIVFTSTPLLPEEEILARLLFGGSITELSATDALQLGSALASLRGGAGLDPINKLRSAIGLDRLRIVSADPALDRGTGVALGKNVGRRFYVEIVTDGRGYSATEAEFRITRWLSLLSSVSTIGRESVVAEISRDY